MSFRKTPLTRALISVSLACAGLSTLERPATAQIGPVPDIAFVPSRRAHDPGNVAIHGSALALATCVKINGVSTPVVRVTPTRLVVGPVPPQPPGFGTVEVIGGRSTDSATIQFLPTLAALRRGTRLDVTLNNGDTGTYVLSYAYALGTPGMDQGIYGTRFLSLLSPILAAGVLADASPLVLQASMPIQIGQIGSPLRLQARCFATTSGVESYTNLATVPGFGDPVGGLTPP
jgi:hypothetical protein